MKPDIVLKEHVLEELEWDPAIKAAAIGVAVKGGVVTLSGDVESYHEKIEAERTTLRVAGVKGLANEIVVQLPGASQRSDADIARAAVDALEWNSSIPPGRIKVVDLVATAHLNAMNARGGFHPWALSFSYGRALQDRAMRVWKGDPALAAAAQQALHHQARCNSAARDGRYTPELERAAV